MGLTLRLVDSHVSGEVLLHKENVRLEMIRSTVVGAVNASNENVVFVITDSTIKGDVNNRSFGGHSLTITEFKRGWRHCVRVRGQSTFDGLHASR